MKIRWIVGGFSILSLFLITGCMHKDPIELDPFEHIQIEYDGWNGQATASATTEIDYAGNNETVLKLIDSLTFRISPNKNLTNGNKIDVKVRYTQELCDLANVEFAEEEKEYTVSGLIDRNQKVVYKDKIVTDDDGEEHQQTEEYKVINGVEIPSSWNLSEAEERKYIEYVKGLEDDTEKEETGVKSNWTQGESEKVTHRKDSSFYNEDYLDNAVTCYQEVYKYGIESSQKFKIEPIIKKEKTIGYKCIFKE